jgi:DNA-binding XRE family transcriptional regulator
MERDAAFAEYSATCSLPCRNHWNHLSVSARTIVNSTEQLLGRDTFRDTPIVPRNPGPDCEVWAPLPALVSGRKDGTMSRRSPQHDGSAESFLQATLARNLRAARKRKGLTQAKVAEAIGVSTNIYGCYENAGTWPSIETLRESCKVLDVSADTLLGIEPGQMSAAPPLPPDDPPMVRRLLGQPAPDPACRGVRHGQAWGESWTLP